MGFLGKARHNLGFHTGDWTYDVQGQCKQTRRCTGCDNVSTRVEHSFGDWYRRLPCDEATCGMIRTCRVCQEFAFKSAHEFNWHFFRQLPQMPDFPSKPRLLKVRVDTPCKQFSMCRHCGLTETKYQNEHDWVSAGVIVEHTQLNDVTSFDSATGYKVCRVCDVRTSAGPV